MRLLENYSGQQWLKIQAWVTPVVGQLYFLEKRDAWPLARESAAEPPRRGLAAVELLHYWPRLVGSTPAKVKKSIMRKLCGVPPCVGSVGTQLGCTLR